MQHRYRTGEVIKLGDRIRDGQSVGVVVGIIETGEYTNGLLKENWDHLQRGILVDLGSEGLTHYPEAEQTAYFQKE